jgi:hypothetical protein
MHFQFLGAVLLKRFVSGKTVIWKKASGDGITIGQEKIAIDSVK